MKFKNFIWDFDGTLVETYYHSTRALMDILEKYSIEADQKEAEETLRISFGKAKRKYGLTIEQNAEFMEKVYTLWFEPNPYVYEGVEEVLAKIVENGGHNFVYTNRNDTTIEYLKAFELDKYFSEIITSENPNWHIKPSGKPILHFIEAYNLNPEETVMVGDREIDITCGKDAGIAGILFDEFEKAETSAADIIIKKFPEIASYIK